MTGFSVYTGLFFASMLAATIIPAQSEAILVALLLSGKYSTGLLITVASVGNVLGSVINWFLGYGVQKLQHKKWFPLKPDKMERAVKWYNRYGKWSLLLSWVPLIGDPLTVAAGVLRENFWVFLLLVTIAKVARYVILAAITLGFFT